MIFDRLTVYEQCTGEALILYRNFSYGSAAACLVILVSILQPGAHELSLKISVFAVSIAMPVWILCGGLLEIYHSLGERSLRHARLQSTRNVFGFLMLVAGIFTMVAAGGIIFFLVEDAIWVFAGMVVLCLLTGIAFKERIARWWFGPDGPGELDDPTINASDKL